MEPPRRPPLLALVLAALLVAWEPFTFALTASSSLARLASYGPPAFLLLLFRGAIVGLGIAAGRGLWTGQPHGPRLARWWAALHAVAVGVTFATPYFPSNRVPSTKRAVLVVLVTMDLLWWAWLQWSPAVKRAYQGAERPHQPRSCRAQGTTAG